MDFGNKWRQDDDRKVFLRKLAWKTTNADLKHHFKRFGAVQWTWILKDDYGVSRRCAFVLFRESESAQACLYDAHKVAGKVIQVLPARNLDRRADVRLASTPDYPDFVVMESLIRARDHRLLQSDHASEDLRALVYKKIQDSLSTLGCNVYKVGSTMRGTAVNKSDLDLACLRDSSLKFDHVVKAMGRFADSVQHEDEYFEDGFESMDNCGTAILKPSARIEVVDHKTVHVMKLRYTHDTIKKTFQDGRQVCALLDDLMTGRISHKTHRHMELECAIRHDGYQYCLNNRRLWCLKEYERKLGQAVYVKVKIVKSRELLWSRLTTVNDGMDVFFRRDGGDDENERDPERLHNISVSQAVCDGVLHVDCDGLAVDIVVGQKPPKAWQGCFDKGVLAERFGRRHQWSAVFVVEHNKLIWPDSVRKAIRLAKVWCKEVAFPQWTHEHRPRSFLIELMVANASSKQKTGWQNFTKFLEHWSRESPKPVLWQWSDLVGSSRVDWGAGPQVLDPCNPTNNVARGFRHWDDLRRYAGKSLAMIRAAEDNSPTTGVTQPTTVLPEVVHLFQSLQLPLEFAKKLADDGFTTLKYLAEFTVERDLIDVGMNKVQARILLKALSPIAHARGSSHVFLEKSSVESSLLPEDSASQVKAVDQSGTAQVQTSPHSLLRPGGCTTFAGGEPPTEMAHPELLSPCCPAASSSLSHSSLSTSFVSSAAEKRCFLRGTLLKTPTDTFKLVESFEAHSLAQAADGKLVRVMSIVRHPLQLCELVSLCVSHASDVALVVTATHRVEVMMDDLPCSMSAESLKLGDLVLCNTGPKQLVGIRKQQARCEIVEVVFDPDVPVEAFHKPGELILTRGSTLDRHSNSMAEEPEEVTPRTSKQRRGGMTKRGKSQQQPYLTSIPNTFDSYN